METFSVLLAICAGNSPVAGEFPAQMPMTRSIDVFFDLRLTIRPGKHWWGWWIETPSRPLWRHCNDVIMWPHIFPGFGLLEAGCVTAKNEVNIMMKNAIDVIFGGLTYWMFGYGLSFGEDEWSNPFVGVGKFCLDSDDPETIGLEFSTYIFQLSFATTATTIVSGAMAERTRLDAYVVFSLLNTVVYCVPAHWLWGSNGFLSQMGE